jgi:hypothetical protein
VPNVVAAGLLVLLGLARAGGGVALLAGEGAELSTTSVAGSALSLVGAGLLGVGALAGFAGIWLFLGRRGAATLSFVALALFLIGGCVNGVALYGAPRLPGVLGNALYAAVVASLVVWGHRIARTFPAA